MNILDTATLIYENLGKPNDISMASILTWLRNSIGNLNILIDGSYTLTSLGDISPELGTQEASIYEKMYSVYFYDLQLKKSLGAAGYQTALEINSDNQSKIRLVNKTEVAKTALQAKKDAQGELIQLLDDYNLNSTTPIQVAGQDGNQQVYPYVTPYNRRSYY